MSLSLTFDGKLGEGAFGVVYSAQTKIAGEKLTVAVKSLKGNFVNF